MGASVSGITTLDGNATGTFSFALGAVFSVALNSNYPVTITTADSVRVTSSVTGNANQTISTLNRVRILNGVSAGANVGTNVGLNIAEMSNGASNVAVWLNSNSANSGSGICAGTAFDTCLYRGRAGAWTGPAGTDIYTDSGYICAGTGCSSVTSTNTGVYDAGVRVMSSVSCTGATCSLTNGALSITVSGGGVTSLAGTTGQITASASTGAVTLSFPSTWAPTVSTMSVTASGPQMRTYMDTSTEWGVYDVSLSRNVLYYERTNGALTFGQRLMVEEEGTIGTSAQLFGGACNPSPFSFGGSLTLAGSQSVFKITLVTGSGVCASTSAAFQFSWTWTGANDVVCTATPLNSNAIDVPLGVDASPTAFVGRVGTVTFTAGLTYVYNVICMGTATQTLFKAT